MDQYRLLVSSDLDDEKMDAFEFGWTTRPSDKLLIELSLYHYETKDAVFSGPPFTVQVMSRLPEEN